MGKGDRLSNFEGESIMRSTPEWMTKGLNNFSSGYYFFAEKLRGLRHCGLRKAKVKGLFVLGVLYRMSVLSIEFYFILFLFFFVFSAYIILFSSILLLSF